MLILQEKYSTLESEDTYPIQSFFVFFAFCKSASYKSYCRVIIWQICKFRTFRAKEGWCNFDFSFFFFLWHFHSWMPTKWNSIIKIFHTTSDIRTCNYSVTLGFLWSKPWNKFKLKNKNGKKIYRKSPNQLNKRKVCGYRSSLLLCGITGSHGMTGFLYTAVSLQAKC